MRIYEINRLVAAAAALAVVAAGGCGQNTSPPPKDDQAAGGKPQAAATRTPASTSAHGGAGGRMSAAGLAFDPPAGWKSVAPASSMRKAQFEIPGADGAAAGELVVFHFGAGQGGDASANLNRWVGQFAPDDGVDPAETMVRDQFEVGALKVTTVEVSGRFVAPVRPGGAEHYDEPGWRMLGAVVEGSGGPWFFKATGPKETMSAAKAGFRSLLESASAGG